MLRRFILSWIATATFTPAFAEELDCQRSAVAAAVTGCLLAAAYSNVDVTSLQALELYRRGLTFARKGDADRAFRDFNKALESEPGLAVAY
jgi:hypothetical protein